MNCRRIFAIFKKQLKDTLKNKTVLIQFIMFPFMAFLLTETIAKSQDGLSYTYFVILFATMYAGMVPTVNMASIITEEKEKNTLRVLMMSNVKPIEYLLGVGSYVFLLCTIGSVFFGLIGGYSGLELIRFILVLMLGILSSILLGSAIGMLTKNQMSATGIVIPIAMVAAFLPMIAMFNATFEKVSKFLYTQQINYLVNDLSLSNFTWDRFITIGANIFVFLFIFIIAFRKGNLAE